MCISFKDITGDPQLHCKMYPGPETVRKSGFTDSEVKNFGIQNGDIPEGRMGHAFFAIDEFLILIGGHKKQWNGSTLSFRNMEKNLYIMDSKSKEWKQCTILNAGENCLKRSLFMYSISGKSMSIMVMEQSNITFPNKHIVGNYPLP